MSPIKHVRRAPLSSKSPNIYELCRNSLIRMRQNYYSEHIVLSFPEELEAAKTDSQQYLDKITALEGKFILGAQSFYITSLMLYIGLFRLQGLF